MQFLGMPAWILVEFDNVTIKWKDSPAGGPVATRHQKRRRINAAHKRALKAAGLRIFMQQCGRKAQKHTEPNDRRYDLAFQAAVRRMDPVVLDRLLRDDQED